MDITFQILANCSNKSYDSLVEQYGKSNVDSLLSGEYIVKLQNGTITKTEKGISYSKPIQSATNEKLGSEGYQLLTDSGKFSGTQLLS